MALILVLLFCASFAYADMSGTICAIDKPLRIFEEFAASSIVGYKGADRENLYAELEASGQSFVLPVGTRILLGNRHSSYPVFIWVDVIGLINETAMALPKSGYVYASDVACQR